MARIRLVAIAIAIPILAGACTEQELLVFHQVTSPTRDIVSEDALVSLRQCESDGDYGAISASGQFRGAYQFSQTTWDGVATRHYPWLVGVDPATAEFYWQDAMARALYSESGARPWPVCGRRM